MTPMLTTIRFKSAYLLCHVNTINAHPMRTQLDSFQIHIETGLRASCGCAFKRKGWWHHFVQWLQRLTLRKGDRLAQMMAKATIAKTRSQYMYLVV